MTTSRRVMPGDKLAIPAEVWNALLDLLNNPPRQRRGLGGSVPRSAWGTTILARNESAAAVAAGQGVYVGTVVVPDPDDALEVFKAGPTITLAAAGTRGGHFAVAAEPMVTNGVGRVWVAGLAVAQVNLTDAAHKFCDLAASPGPLTSAVTGPARILWSNGVASPTWCIIRFEGSGIVGDETWIGSTTGGVKSKDLLRDANGNQVVGHNAQGPITTTPGPVSALSDWRGAFDTSLTMPDHGFTITPYTDNVDANGHSTLVAGAPFYIKFDPAEVPGFTDTDELVACSANDTTPDYLHEKLETWVGDSDHIAVEWETQNDGGDEQERLKINKTDVGGGFAKSLDVWVRVTANTAKTYVSTDDWRGRMFHILGAYSDTNVSDANGQPWVSQAHSAFLVGTNFDARGGYGDVTVASVAAGRGNVSLGIEDDTGQLFVEVTSYSAEFQVRFLVQATNVKSAADVTVT